MFTTILIVSLSISVILLAREILKLKERLNVLHNETNNRISVTDQQIHLKINEEINLLESKLKEVKTNMISLLDQKLSDEIENVKSLIPPTNKELMDRIETIEEESYRLRMNM
jgi:hypothetical protein